MRTSAARRQARRILGALTLVLFTSGHWYHPYLYLLAVPVGLAFLNSLAGTRCALAEAFEGETKP